MSFKDEPIKISYRSRGEESISSFINPLLKDTSIYKRSVGYFSSSALDLLDEGISSLEENGGNIYLLTSPKLSEEDINAINLGYDIKEIVYSATKKEIEEVLNELDDQNLKRLAELIINDILEIKIIFDGTNQGMYHDKLAVLYDNDGNKVAFVGSSNESSNGYKSNYEKIRVFTSWKDKERVDDEEKEFDDIWNNENEYLNSLEFKDALKDITTNVCDNRNIKIKKEPFNLRKYQRDAIKAWKENGYKGFYTMATGTGKTITALYSIKTLINNSKNKIFTIIAVPYKHLVSQWYEDAKVIFPNNMIQKISGEINQWDVKLKNAILADLDESIICITTIKSLYSEKFNKVKKLINNDILLVVDEAHNFLQKIQNSSGNINCKYKLGLSATPIFGSNEDKTNVLLEYFGGEVYSLPIEKAIGKFLVNYEYHPIFVSATGKDEDIFTKGTQKMISARDDKGNIIDEKLLMEGYRMRLRAIAQAENKINGIPNIIKNIDFEDHFIVYCSDGKSLDDGKRSIEHVVDILNDNNFYPSQFTCEENMDDRERLVNNFNKGVISTLVAIRCLDEGINIPSIKKALILASYDNYREFVQRRGRILRKYPGKDYAEIYDVIVLPSTSNCLGMVKIELKRYLEYAKLALNKEELLAKLDSLLDSYSLSIEDVQFDNDYIETTLDD